MTGGDALQLVVDLAVQTLTGVTGASVSVVNSDDGVFQTAAASSELLRKLDEHQYEAGDGPCVSAIRSGSEQAVTVGQGKYSSFEEVASHAGVAFVWALPLAVADGRPGSLNLYFGQVAHKLPSQPGPARAVAGLAARALVLDQAQAVNARLWAALASRGLIGQAQGIIMAREQVDADAAFDILRRASQRTNRKLRDLATELVADTVSRPRPELGDHGHQ